MSCDCHVTRLRGVAEVLCQERCSESCSFSCPIYLSSPQLPLPRTTVRNFNGTTSEMRQSYCVANEKAGSQPACLSMANATKLLLSPADSLLTLIFSAPLQSILRDLLTAVQQTPGAMQLARAHLYGALLYFLTVSRQQHSSDSTNHRGCTIPWKFL